MQYVAKVDQTVDSHDVRDHSNGWVIVSRSGWEFMVLRKHLNGGWVEKSRQLRESFSSIQYGTFNKCALGRNGKGANRRRNQRRRRR